MRLLLAVRNFFSLPSHFVISAILIAGFGLRVVGINVGLPEAPDPREAIIAQNVLNLIHFTAPPETYNWPGTAWFYIIAAVGKLLSIGGLHLTEARVILLARLHQHSLIHCYTLVHLFYWKTRGQQARGTNRSGIARSLYVTRHQRIAFRTCGHPRHFLCNTVSLDRLPRSLFFICAYISDCSVAWNRRRCRLRSQIHDCFCLLLFLSFHRYRSFL